MEPTFRALPACGISAARALEAAIIPERLFDHGGRVTVLQLHHFYAELARREGDLGLGFRIPSFGGQDIDFYRLGLFGCPNLKLAFELFIKRMLPLVDGLDMRIHIKGDKAWLLSRLRGEYDDLDWVSNQRAFEALVNVVRLVAEKDWMPSIVSVPRGESSVGSGAMIGERYDLDDIKYGTGYVGVCLDYDLLFRPLREPDLAGVSIVEGFDLTRTVTSFLGTVEEMVFQHLRAGSILGHEDVAEICGISHRTLSRALNEGGGNFRSIVNRVRCRRACDLLRGEAAIKSIAYELGYGSLSSFMRAFKAYTGKTPTEYRRGLS